MKMTLSQSNWWLEAVSMGMATLLTVCVVILLTAILYPPLASADSALSALTSSSAQDRLPSSGDLAYVTLSGSDLVALIDTTTHTEIGTVNVGAAGCDFPWRATMSPDGNYVYVGCRSSGNVAVIETTGNTVVTTVEGIDGADGIAFTRDGAYALVGSRWNSQIAVVDTTTYFITFISTPAPPRSIAAHPYLDRAYATCTDGTIQVIDTTTLGITESIPVGSDPHDVAVSPDGRWVFAGSRRGDGLAVIDADSNTLHTTVTGLGDLTGLEVAPDGSVVYACGLSNGLHVIDGVTFDPITTVAGVGNAWQAAVTCDGSELLVGSKGDQVPVIDTATFSVTQEIPMSGYGARGIAICPQYVASGVVLSPPVQTNSGARGEVVTHQETLINVTGATDGFSLTLGSHVWDTALSTDSLGPIADGDSTTFTVYVTVPVGVDWYLTDTVLVSATSAASPTVYSDTATFTTQAYAPSKISVSPDVLTSTQYVDEVVARTLTISNGNGVTLTFSIAAGGIAVNSLESILDSLNSDYQAVIDAIPNRYDFSEGETGNSIGDGGNDMYDGGNFLSTDLGGNVEYSNNTIIDSAYFGNSGRYFTRKYPGLFLLVADMDAVDYFQISGNLGADGGGSADGTILQTDLYGLTYYGFVKRVFNAGDPSVNHLIIVADNPSANHAFSTNTNDDHHQVYNLSRNARLYYLLYAGANGYYIDDTATLNIMQTFLDALGLLPPAPWLSADPALGEVPTESSAQVQVTLDASGIQPSDYSAFLAVNSNDPVSPSIAIPVTMTVEPMASMGWVEGAVTDARTSDPLEATIIAFGQPYTVTTDPDTGAYILWLDEGSYTLQVAAEGYVTATAAVDIVAQQGTTQDFALVLNVPVLEVAPESLQVTQQVGEVATRMLTINNNGPAPLTFELHEFDTGFSPTTTYASLSHGELAILADTTGPGELDQRSPPTTAYVMLSHTNLVSLVDTTTHTEIGTVNVGAAACDFPWRASMSPDGNYVYVGCYNSGNVAVIETAGNTVVTTVEGIPSADGIAFTRDGAYALVGSRRSSQIAVVDTVTYSSVFIPTPSVVRSIVAHPYHAIVYATCGNGTILVIDTITFAISTDISIGGDPWDVAVSPDGQWVFASDRQGAGLAVIDADSNTLYTTVTGLGDLNGLAVAPDGSEIYASAIRSGVRVIDGAAFNLITTIPGTGRTWELAAICDGGEVYVGNTSHQVPVINTSTYSVTAQIPVSGSGARGISICPQHVAGDVPWLFEEPISGTMPGYSSMPIQVTLDATGAQPGDYTADIIVQSNDPVTRSVSVPVTMTVGPTADMGRVTGSVSDAWTGQPLNATVDLVGVYSMTASPDYTIWAPAGTYSLAAYTSGYYTTTRSVIIPAGGVITEDLALEPAQPRLEWAPEAVSATAVEGGGVIHTLMISNTGPLPLDIALHEINPIAALRALSPSDLTGKHILYDRAHDEPGTGDYSSLINDAISAGAVVTENWYFPIDASVLEGYDVLWVNCCGGTAWGFSELNAVSDWLNEGGAVLVQGESSAATSGPASIFGINYQSGSCSSGTTTDITEHPISEGVDAVNVEWTCWRLAPGSGADIVVFDTPGQPHVVAQEQNGGKMVVVASEDFTDWHIDNDDNRLLANNILAWLARPAYSDVPWLTETPQAGIIPGHSSLPITLEFDATTLSLGAYQATLAIEHNDPSQPLPIELPVTLNVIEPWNVFLPLILKSSE